MTTPAKTSSEPSGSSGPRAIVRRHAEAAGSPSSNAIDVAALARVAVTSEQSLYPIDNTFDEQSGPGGSCWVASSPGVQTVTLSFSEPHDLRTIDIESEERGDTRTQEVSISLSIDGGVTYTASPPRMFGFTPYGPSFHRERWAVATSAVTHVRLSVTPMPPSRHASLTSIVLR